MNARLLFVLVGATVSLVGAEKRDQEFALILEDEPVAQRFAVRSTTTRTVPAAAESHRQIIRVKQAGIKRQLSQRNVRITGSTDTLVNAIFVKTAIANISNLRTLDGVKAVALLPRIHRNLD